MSNKKAEAPKKADAIIIHCDGGCSPNPGNGGWGMHGYAYISEAPKKGSGNSTHYVTNKGYVDKFMLDAFQKGEDPYAGLDFSNMKQGTESILDTHLTSEEVTPLFYVDGFGPMGQSTNNASEMTALLRSLEFAIEHEIKKVHIFSDSEYTLEGYQKGLPIWQRNKWCRRDGTEIKNKELWQRLLAVKEKLKAENYEVKMDWLPGHSIFLGNIMADTNATLGKCKTMANVAGDVINVVEAQGYWKAEEVDRHPLIVHQRMFFNGDSSDHQPGVYYLGAIDKDLGQFGKKLSDSSYSIVRTKEPIESLEKLIAHHCDLGEDREETVIANLSVFYKATVYEQFMNYGTFALYQPNLFNNNLQSADKQLVTEVCDPAKKSLEGVLALNNLSSWLTEWLEKAPSAKRFVETDITPHLYESSVVKKKNKDVEVVRLNASIKPGVASITIDANYRDSNEASIVLPTTLTFGIDLADRNGLKRIEELSPKVTLLSWEESPGVFRYFTVLQAGDDVGAYCGYYSNIRLNKLKVGKKSK